MKGTRVLQGAACVVASTLIAAGCSSHADPAPAETISSTAQPLDYPGVCGVTCTGACGPNCTYCQHSTWSECEHVPGSSELTGIMIYHRHELCPTHQGCRDHDACLDNNYYTYGCDESNPAKQAADNGCHLACVTTYGPIYCPLWAIGQGPTDGQLAFDYDDRVSDPSRCPPPPPPPVCTPCSTTVCGPDKDCNSGQDCGTCPTGYMCTNGGCVMSTVHYCGDGTCDLGEDQNSCCTDCGCPTGQRCDANACHTYCGNGTCDPGEDCSNCASDCVCGTNETCSNGACVSSTIGYCGDGTCGAGEDCNNCPDDCGACSS
jgi:hypothetical protein